MEVLCSFVGVDWGRETHQVCVVDENGVVCGEKAFKHSGPGLSQMAGWVQQRTQLPPASIGVAIEVPHGPVVESLMDSGFALYSLNPKQLDRFRDRFSPAGAKDDRRDALTLAAALRTDGDWFRRIQPVDPEVIQLRGWTRMASQLTAARVQIVNRIRDQLWGYYPQILEIESDFSKGWVQQLWKRAPTPDKARRIHGKTVARLLKAHRVRRLDASSVLGKLREPGIKVAEGTTQAAVNFIEVQLRHLVLVNEDPEEARRQIDLLTGDMILQSSGERECDTYHDAEILLSIPGVGRVVLATLLSEAHDALQRRDYQALRCLTGVAPVTRRSGKSMIVKRRLAASKRLQNALYYWAMSAIRYDAVSRAKYTALRERGHQHPRALRTVGDRLLRIACSMLESNTKYAPQEARKTS